MAMNTAQKQNKNNKIRLQHTYCPSFVSFSLPHSESSCRRYSQFDTMILRLNWLPGVLLCEPGYAAVATRLLRSQHPV